MILSESKRINEPYLVGIFFWIQTLIQGGICIVLRGNHCKMRRNSEVHKLPSTSYPFQTGEYGKRNRGLSKKIIG
jgi:hypothetical protein